MEQSLFDFDETEVASKPVPKVYSWNWWDPWPLHWTDQQCYLAQIARDMRALEEVTDEWPDDVDQAQFFRDRIAHFRAVLQKKDGDESQAQHKQPAAAPGSTS